jgi:hypothetical protein
MKTTKHSFTLALLAAGFMAGAPLSAADCDKLAADVRAAIEANPSKVLVIVEDAMIANEACACEIVKTAMVASKANAELTRQIVLTASNVAPNLSQLIAECARGVLAADGTSGKTGKEVKNVIDVQPQPVNAPDYQAAPADIRGVYLIQPSAGGIITTKDCECDDKTKKRPPPDHEPQSPSTSRHKK